MKNKVIGNTDIVSGILDEQNEFTSVYSKGQAWLNELRIAGKNAFSEQGVPKFKDEEWKYTHIAKALGEHYHLPHTYSLPANQDLSNYKLLDANTVTLVYINGIPVPELSDKLISEGVTAAPASDVENSSEFKTFLGSVADISNHNFSACNTAFLNNPCIINVKAGVQSPKTIQIIHLLGTDDNDSMCFPRTLIHTEKGAYVEVVESYYSLPNSNQNFCAAVTEIIEEENSHVDYYKYEDVSDSTILTTNTYFKLQRDSRSESFTFSLNGKLIRNDLDIKLTAENGHAELHGIYLPNGQQHFDNHTLVDHISPHCYSNELYKGVMGGSAHAVFNGKVYVRRDAQKTNAYQSNNNILLSDEAQIDTKPQLEIYADDVKCSHGATTGQLDDDALFYLRARGIGENEARNLLVTAFSGEALNEIPNETLRDVFADKIHRKLSVMSH